MRRGTSYWVRSVAAISALCGVALYSALIPGHIVSQVMSAVAAGSGATGRITGFSKVICRSGAEKESPAPGARRVPEKKCPFCSGYASFVVASLSHPSIAVIAVERASPAHASFEAVVVRSILRAPQSRGPPHTPA
jgi:hypothetical protein